MSHRRLHERGSAAAWILALLVLGGIGFAIYWFVVRAPGGGASSSLAARVLPAEVDTVGGLDVARIAADPNVRKLLALTGRDFAAIEAELAKANVKLSDFQSLVFGARTDGGAVKDAIVAVEAKTDAKAVAGAMQTFGAMLPESLRGVASAARVEAIGGGVLLTGSGELLDKALAVAKGAGEPLGAKAGLDDVRESLDTGAMGWMAAPIPANVLAALPSMAKSILGGTPSHFGVSASVGDPSELRFIIHFPGGDGSQIASALDTAVSTLAKNPLPIGPRLGEKEKALLQHLELTGSGPNVVAKLKLSAAELDAILGRGGPDEAPKPGSN